ncbi:MAG: hypothetical protein WB783_18470 [Arenicellales bacterium]
MTKTPQWASGALLYLLLGVTLLVYWPGLHGPLVLDDISNLGRLKDIGDIDGLPRFLQFIFSGSHEYPSRPLSLASFLINDRGWPLYVPAQKYTNVLIHLLNGTLVFWLAWLLCSIPKASSRARAAVSLTTAALWLLAPLLVSTVLYLIQRMTELSATFVLAGLIVYCYGRRRLNERPVLAISGMTAGVGLASLLGFLCKENAVLLGLYALAMEHTLLKPHLPVRDTGWRLFFTVWKWVVLVLPVVLAFAAIIFIRGAVANYRYRPFTLFERTASQPRILFDYLQGLLLPVRHGMGIAHDDFLLSTGWLSPPTTIIAVIALLGAVAAAIYFSRKGFSLFGFAVLWFVAGHLMESSFVPLEPYFEHRNYLPAFGLYFALSYFIWTTRISGHRYLKVGLALYLATFVVVTLQNVDVWTSKAEMAEVWGSDHPHSVRAQQIRADVWSRAGHREKAFEILANIADARRNTMGPQVEYLLAGCRAQPDNVGTYLRQTESRISSADYDFAVVPTLITLKDTSAQECPKLSPDDLLGLIDKILRQKSVSIRRPAISDLLYVRATVLAGKGEYQNAVSNLYVAFKTRPSYQLGLASAKFLYNLKQYREALKVIEDVEAIHLKPWDSDNFRRGELKRWTERIQTKLKQRS